MLNKIVAYSARYRNIQIKDVTEWRNNFVYEDKRRSERSENLGYQREKKIYSNDRVEQQTLR